MKVMRGLTNGIMCPKIIRSSISVILYDIYSKYLIILQSDPGRKKGLTFLQTVKFSNVLNISKVTLLKTCSHCKQEIDKCANLCSIYNTNLHFIRSSIYIKNCSVEHCCTMYSTCIIYI